MKRIDIRRVYVGEILKQKEVKQVMMKYDPLDNYKACSWDYLTETDLRVSEICVDTWDYEQEKDYGLFVKTFGGYKHILTDTVYPRPSEKTGNKQVIGNVEKLTKKERDLSSHLIQKYKTFFMDLDVIKALEDRIKDSAKEMEEGKEI